MTKVSKRAPDSDNYLYGKGELYFAPFDDDGNNQGEIDLGNVPDFVLAVNADTVEHYSSREGFRKKDFEATIKVGANIAFTVEEAGITNLGMAILTDVTTAMSQTSGTVTKENFYAHHDRWVPLAKRYVSSVVLATSAGAAFTANSDFKVDSEGGRIIVLSTGTISNHQSLHVSYVHNYWTTNKISALKEAELRGMVRFRGTPEYGPAYEIEIWSAKLKLAGDVPFIGDDISQIKFTGEVLDDTENHPDDPFFRLFERNF